MRLFFALELPPELRAHWVRVQDAIRPHVKIFVNRHQVASVASPLAPGDEVLVVAALSGG